MHEHDNIQIEVYDLMIQNETWYIKSGWRKTETFATNETMRWWCINDERIMILPLLY